MPADLTFPVDAALGGQAGTQAAWLFVPAQPARAKAVLVCLAGGSYDKHYWHLEVPGHPGYSFAEYMSALGYVVVAVDHLAVGDSTDPAESHELGMPLLAAGDVLVARQIRERLAARTLASSLPADLPVVGVGHSMGACLTTMVQATSEVYDAVVLLGYGVQIANVNDVDHRGADMDTQVAETMVHLREAFGASEDAVSGYLPRGPIRPLFHAPDVPDAVVTADDTAASRVPILAASQVTTPGYVQSFAQMITVPVFLGFGAAIDVSPGPHTEPANYPASGDVTLYLVPGSGHCHNFASARALLWDRIACWLNALRSPDHQPAADASGEPDPASGPSRRVPGAR
jgi:dienelactone hydrolase